ncbi:MAG: PorT family protein [Bacteroidetes bacterium]|nr:PorT family protein [Bacteroidota bacterium]
MPLLRSVIILHFIILLLPLSIYSQQPKVKNLPNYDRQRFHFGFTLGINNMGFAVKRNPDLVTYDTVFVIEAASQSGFNLGIISNMRVGEYLDLRFIPALSFAQRTMHYTFARSTDSKIIESTFLEFPLDLKFKSYRINNYRVYVLGGVKIAYDLASQKAVEEKTDIVKLQRFDHYWEIGFGFDFYLHYFKFAPELKVGFGVNNVLVPYANVYSSSLDALKSKVVLLSFNFE